ncbi:type VI secretion system protein TssA [Orrella daihaiensis]|uniref:Type VI secretion system protein TssA n=1 Tax=Orrella daihaiensis TaxID=2782176 RepID=A0ABY4AK96_9BURK|nr:type VI secretion system protein TssA [Orrella daihaiensis]UOD50081.1 type VI secretion system protein TssA [Orrella daihaiensis]
MALELDPLLQPLPEGSDAEEPRESERFTELEREIDKLSSLTADSLPNWVRVEQLACEFLTLQSKDYLVASWLSEAWTQRHAILGVSAGLGLFAGLSEKFWDTSIPPVGRLRGRRNAMLWWIDRVTDWLEKQTDVAIGADLAEKMISSAKRLDALMAEKDPEAPSLANLLSHLQRIPVEQPAVTSIAAPPVSPATEPAEPATPDSGQQSTAATVDTTPATTSPATVSATAIKAPSFSGSVEINSFDDVVRLLKPAQDYIAQIGPALLAFDHAHPLAIYLSRFAARAAIFEIPPATNGQTAIAPPPVAIVDAFEKVSGSKNAQNLIEFCESRVRAFPFWLDMDYHSARGFAMMGSAGAKMREGIIDMLLAFVSRIPTIEQFTFSNGMPFASLETINWIKQCRDERAGKGHQDTFDEVRSNAQAQLAEGKLGDAQEILQGYIANNRSQREQFRARIELVQMLLSQDPQADLLALVEPLIDDCKRLTLEQWEPELASQAWSLKVRAARQVVESSNTEIDANRRTFARTQMEEALKHLSVTDFATAARLAS